MTAIAFRCCGMRMPQHTHTAARVDAQVLEYHLPTSSQPLCVQAFSIYACRSTPF